MQHKSHWRGTTQRELPDDGVALPPCAILVYYIYHYYIPLSRHSPHPPEDLRNSAKITTVQLYATYCIVCYIHAAAVYDILLRWWRSVVVTCSVENTITYRTRLRGPSRSRCRKLTLYTLARIKKKRVSPRGRVYICRNNIWALYTRRI